MLDVQNIVKKYKHDLILDDVSFHLAEGEALLLLGENGSGKTTLLLSVAGLLTLQQGTVLLDGQSTMQSTSKVRSKIAYVPQEPALLNGLSVQDNLSYWASAAGLPKPKLQIDSLVHHLNLRAELHKKIGKLSGGMKKRVNLAASLFHTPRLLLLDEPFANVDTETKAAIYTLLSQYRQAGCAMILVSHIDDEALRFADRALTLQSGKLVNEFSVEEEASTPPPTGLT